MSLRVRHVLSAQGAFDYATNTQSLYKLHLDLAAIADVTVRRAAWKVHIELTILPSYAREFKEPTTCMAADEFEKLAAMLQKNYAEHLKERVNETLMKLIKD